MMDQKFRRGAARLLLILCLLFAPACAGAQPRQVVVAWHTLSGARERALLQLIDRWNRTNGDGVVIVPERREASAQHDALLAGAATGALPGLALVEPAEAALFDQRGLLTQLDAFANSDDTTLNWDASDRADLFPFVQQAGRTPQGRLVGVPFGGAVRLLLGNRDWVNTLGQADLPTTWDAFGKLCDGATDRFAGTLCFGFNPNDASIEEWMHAYGAPIYDPVTQQLQIAAPAAVSAVEQLLTYLQSGRAYRAQSPERSRDDFAAARVLFAFTTSDHLSDFVNTVRERSNFNLDAGVLPSDANEPSAALKAPVWVIPKSTRDRERLAWKFVNWLLEAEQTAQWATLTGELPARISAISMLDLKPAQPRDALHAQVLQRVAPHARPVPLLSGWPCVQEELANSARQIIEGQPITDTLLLAQARAQNVVNEDCSAR